MIWKLLKFIKGSISFEQHWTSRQKVKIADLTLSWKKNFSPRDIGLFGYVYKTTGCFDMFWQVSINNPWRQRPVGVRESSRISGAKPREI